MSPAQAPWVATFQFRVEIVGRRGAGPMPILGEIAFDVFEVRDVDRLETLPHKDFVRPHGFPGESYERPDLVPVRFKTQVRSGEKPKIIPMGLIEGEDRDDRRIVVLLRSFFYYHPKSDTTFVILRGFESDFASIPAAGRFAIPSFGNHAEAAIIHDFLYAVGGSPAKGRRKFADDLFRDVMEESDVSVAGVMHTAVRVGGGSAFGADQEWRYWSYEKEKRHARADAPPKIPTAAYSSGNIGASKLPDEHAIADWVWKNRLEYQEEDRAKCAWFSEATAF